MSHPVNAELYDKVLNNEEFLNSIFQKLDNTTKIEVLENSGFDPMEEWIKQHGEAEDQDPLI